MNRLPVVSLPVLTLGFLALAPLAWAQTTRNQMLEAANTARMQSKMEQATGYTAPESAPRSSQAYTPISTSSSNRDYDQREQEAALARSRRMKEMMRDVSGSTPSIDRRSGPVSTGITDGNWQTDRLARIRDGYDGIREEEPRGMLGKMGSALDSISSKEEDYIQRRRSGELDEGFHPLERLSPEHRQELNRAPEEPGFFQKLPDAAGAAVGGIGAAAGKLIPSPRSDDRAADESDRVRIQSAQSGNEAMGAPVVVAAASPSPVPAPTRTSAPAPAAASAPAPENATPASAAAPKQGFSLPWKRPERGLEEFQPASTSEEPVVAKPEPKVESKPKQEEKPSRFTASGIGRTQSSGPSKKEPTGPLAPEKFQVVQNPTGTEFYPYDSPSPIPKILPEGGLLEILKPGDEWSGVVLPDGTEGIVRTGMLRRARMSEMPKEAFAEPTIPSLPPSKTINYDGSSNVPLPDLPTQDDLSMPLGQGLLPPLQPDN